MSVHPTVTVNSPAADKTVSAQAGTVCSGSGTNIQVASSESGVSYQLKTEAGASVGGPVAGTGDTIDLPTGSLTSTTQFKVEATNSPCSAVTMTNHPTVTVTALTAVSVPPDDTNVLDGAPASFTVTASGAGLTYKWQRLNDSTWTDLTEGGGYSDVASQTLHIASADDAKAGQFRCVITGDCGVVNTEPKELTIAPKVTTWYSVKSHGPAGEKALPMDPAKTGSGGDSPFVEPRRGDLKLRMVFDRPVQANGTLAGALSIKDSGNNPVTAGTIQLVDSQTLEITIPEASADARRLTVELFNAGDHGFRGTASARALLLGDRDCQVRCLIGDVNASGIVNTTDMSAVRSQVVSATPVSQSTCVYDVNLSGTITIVDMGLVRSRGGNTVP
jgi:hypothetical protein